MIVTVKSSGCLQIEFGPLIIDYIYFSYIDPPNFRKSNLKVLNRSQSGPIEGKVMDGQIKKILI